MSNFAPSNGRTSRIITIKIRKDEKNIPASQQEKSEQARLPRAYGNKERPPRAVSPPRKGPQETVRIGRASRQIGRHSPRRKPGAGSSKFQNEVQ